MTSLRAFPFSPARLTAALTLLLTPAGAALAQIPAAFAPVSTYPTSSFPIGVAVADVNGDRLLDIVTASPNTDQALVLPGQAGGGFGAATAYPTGTNSKPQDVAVADVNGDGRLDIVTANYGNDEAGVLLGLAGGFSPATTYSNGPGSQPHRVAVADVSGDGRLDIVTINYSSGTVGVLAGLAGGGFGPVAAYPTAAGSLPTGLVVADVNGDGQPDIVTANLGTNSAGVLLGLAGGGFRPITTYSTGTGSGPVDVAVADVSGDGRPDIVTANNSGSSTAGAGVLLGLASGGFGPVTTYSAGSSNTVGVAVADVNGDGRLDLIATTYSGGTAGVLLGLAGGGFSPVAAYSTGANSRPYKVAVADLNGDRRPDIITANAVSNTVGVLLNAGPYTPLAAAVPTATAEVTLFPNPTHGPLAVGLPATWVGAAVQAEAVNALGQARPCQLAGSGPTRQLATGGLPPGVYLLRLQQGDSILARRLVVE